MKYDELLIIAADSAGIPTRAWRETYLKAIAAFLHFCHANALLKKKVIARKKIAPTSTIVNRSDFTDEGFRFFRSIYEKWIEATDKDAVASDDTTLLEKALARTRSPRKIRGKKRPSKAVKAQTKTRKRPVKRPRSDPVETIPDDFELTGEEEKEFLASGPRVYDKADWHLEGVFPADLKPQQAYVHTGMYMRWLVEMNFIAAKFLDLVGPNKAKKLKGSQIYKMTGGVLASDMLTDTGNQFTLDYYDPGFFRDLQRLLAKQLPSAYHVKESPENYEIIRKCIRDRFNQWQSRRKKKIKKKNYMFNISECIFSTICSSIEHRCSRPMSFQEQQALRDFPDDILENELEFTGEFKANIDRANVILPNAR